MPLYGQSASVAIGTPVGSGSSGSVLFVDTAGQLGQDNAHLFWDDANNRLGVGTASPSYPVHVVGEVAAFDTSATPVRGLFKAVNPLNNFPQTHFQIGQSASDLIANLVVSPLFSSAGVQKVGSLVVASNKDLTDSGEFDTYLLTDANGDFGPAAATIGSEAVGGAVEGNGLAMGFTTRVLFAGIPYALWITNTSAQQIGIGGLTSPTARLHIAAGTATANTSPLKLNSGTLLTAPEAGAIEFLTDLFYATTTTGTIRRALVAASTGRKTAQNSAQTLATYTLGASDASFVVSANILVTTATTHNFTVTCSYTDEGNTARVLTLSFTLVAGGAFVTAVANGNGAVPYMGIPQHIRCKASTTITIATTGTFTTVTYNGEGLIQQAA